MTVFKTFLKVLNKCKAPIIMYTVFLIFFGGFNMQTSENATAFEATKPDILIVNNDEERGITKDLIDYITENSNIIEIDDSEDARNDALFYRDVNYIIYIPDGFREDFLNHKNPKIEIKSTGDYQSSLAEMMLERYMKVANTYNDMLIDESTNDNGKNKEIVINEKEVDNKNNANVEELEEELIKDINQTLEKEAEIEMTSKLDTNSLSKATFFYNFMNYSMLAGTIYVICLILSSFKQEKIRKRTVISSMDYKKYNRQLLLSSSLFAIVLWVIYVILSFILVGKVMFTNHGLIYIINSLVFTICALTISLLLGNLVNNKNALNGIINVIALGSSFLCGAFVPMEWLPDSVINIAHILPSYWYIKTNELLKVTESINIESIKPVLGNMLVIMIFSLGFVIVTNIVSRKKN